MKKSILILGAGLMQKPAILSAKKLGFHTVVVDANPKAEAVSFADEFRRIDLKDREEILAFATELKKAKNLQGIFTAGTDFSASVSYASEKLGFASHSFEAALNASIKPRMRACFDKSAVPSPKFFSITGAEITEAKVSEIVNNLGFPCVVKPADNMGARGCRMIRDESEAWSSVKTAAENSRTKTVIIENYMDGPEFSIDALVYNGTVTITGFADRHIFYPPYFIETGHTIPSVFPEEKREQLILAFAKGIKSLGLTCGAAKADIKYTEKGPEIGEIAARLSGGYMSGWTFPYSSDCNLTEQAILIATGNKPEFLLNNRVPLNLNCPEFQLFNLPVKKTSAERAWISIPGKVMAVEGLENAADTQFVRNVFPRPVKKGDKIDFPRNNVQKCGNVISVNEDYDAAVNACRNAVSKVLVRLEPDNPETEKFLSGECLPDEKGFPPSAFSNLDSLKSVSLDDVIPENTNVYDFVKNNGKLFDLLNTDEKDWNYLTALQTVRRFDQLCKKHPELSAKRFFSALLKGGLQAAIYVSDSTL